MSEVKSFPVQKGIPIPEPKSPGARKYPWNKLAPGGSFFIPRKSVDQVSSAVSNAAKRLGWKFTMRSVIEKKVPGVRVWRIDDENEDSK